MVKDCYNCTEKCPQAEIAHRVAVGRMYATKAFIELKNKVEKGELVEVVRCKDCKHWHEGTCWCDQHSHYDEDEWNMFDKDDFCSYGERKDND